MARREERRSVSREGEPGGWREIMREMSTWWSAAERRGVVVVSVASLAGGREGMGLCGSMMSWSSIVAYYRLIKSLINCVGVGICCRLFYY